MYAQRDLFAQAAYLGQQLHWSLSDVLDLEHEDREAFIATVGAWHDDDGVGEDEDG